MEPKQYSLSILLFVMGTTSAFVHDNERPFFYLYYKAKKKIINSKYEANKVLLNGGNPPGAI
jgi:hypothetical protein